MAYGNRWHKKSEAYTRAYAKRTGKRAPRKRTGARKSIVKIVKSVLSRQAENKAWFDYGENQSIATASSSTPSFKNLIPPVAQGTGHSQRIGNEIRVKSGFIRGHVNIKPYDATLNNLPLPCYVKMWVLSCKTQNTTDLASTDIASSFFDVVNSDVGFQGSMLDIDFTVNKDTWTVYASKIVKIGSGYNLTGPVTNLSYFDNSSMSVPFYFNIGKHMKTIKYADGTVPTNKNMFIIFQAVTATGSPSANQIMAEYHYSTRVEYEDL